MGADPRAVGADNKKRATRVDSKADNQAVGTDSRAKKADNKPMGADRRASGKWEVPCWKLDKRSKRQRSRGCLEIQEHAECLPICQHLWRMLPSPEMLSKLITALRLGCDCSSSLTKTAAQCRLREASEQLTEVNQFLEIDTELKTQLQPGSAAMKLHLLQTQSVQKKAEIQRSAALTRCVLTPTLKSRS